MGGVQYENVDPIWGYQRGLTRRRNTDGTGPSIASGDYLLVSGTTGRYINVEKVDASACSRVTEQFAGTTGYRVRSPNGSYCGSFYSPGYRTLANGTENAQLYTHASYDAGEHVQLYGDLLYNYNETRYATGSNYTWWGSSAKYRYFYDTKLRDYVQMQRAFSPEDVGGYDSIMNKSLENAYMLTLGAQGRLGSSAWDYDLGFTHSDDQLNQRGLPRTQDRPVPGALRQRAVLRPAVGQPGAQADRSERLELRRGVVAVVPHGGQRRLPALERARRSAEPERGLAAQRRDAVPAWRTGHQYTVLPHRLGADHSQYRRCQRRHHR
jgi:hypothetical protein